MGRGFSVCNGTGATLPVPFFSLSLSWSGGGIEQTLKPVQFSVMIKKIL
jgi:hypothetical protein